MDPLTDLPAGIAHIIHPSILDQISGTTMGIRVTTKTDTASAEIIVETEVTNKITGLTKEIIAFKTGTATTKTEIGLTTEDDQTNTNTNRNQPRAQVIFKYTNQKPLELMWTIRNLINFMKTCPASREQFKSNKIAQRNFHNEVNESEIYISSLEQVQQLINKDADLVFDALVAADYIDEIECMDGNNQPTA